MPLRILFCAALALALSGCLEVDTKVLVNADGSGTVTERIVLKGPMALMMQQMSADASSVIDQQQVDKHAKELGRGVKVSSVKHLPKSEGIGALATFAFDDVNELQVEPNPTARDGAQSAPAIATSATPISFHFVHGSPAVLTVTVGGAGDAKPSPVPDANTDALQMAPKMVKQMLAGLRIAVAVGVSGEIIDTNATYRDGNNVTLMELDFDAILANPDGLKAMQSPAEATKRDLKAVLKAIPGVKVETQREVRIVFAAQKMASR